MGSSVRFRVLGPLVAEGVDGPLELKGPRHRAVLARLLVARGRVVPVDVLAADLWAEPPDGAIGSIQTFVGALRRALEPARPPRAPASLLVTSGPGYALRTSSVDAWDFEAAVTEVPREPAAALSQMDEALAWWRGPAYAEFDGEAWARAEITRLEELRLLAHERRSSALLALGRAAAAVPDLEAHTAAHPLREEGWRLLALALYRAGRQGDALAALRRARGVLADELGVDPGPALRELESAILAQSAGLAPRSPAPVLVGRTAELARLDAAVDSGARLAVLSGEAGAGKTALAEAFAARMATRGWTTAWGTSPEQGDVRAGPWAQILDSLAPAHGPVPVAAASEDPAVTRFRRHRAIRGYLARISPLLVVLDDLHWADEETLDLVAAVVGAPTLVVATYRSTEGSPGLTALLGRVARAEPVRVYLGGLSAEAVPDLVRATTGRVVDADAARAIHRRSGGNPFFVRELARLADDGSDLSAVPAGVRDVVRYRLSGLSSMEQSVLGLAAVLGTEVDLGVLTALRGDAALDAVETAVRRGFLVERGPRRFRFAHALVRDTVYEDLSRSRRALWHGEIGVALEKLHPDDVASLAHHFVLAERPDAVRYARAAAEAAERRFAPHEAARWWQAALEEAGADLPERLTLIMGLVRALAVTGALDRAREYRAEAIDLAQAREDVSLTAQVITAFDVPALWTENDDPALASRIAVAAERTLAALPPDDEVTRRRLLATSALELRNTGGARARAAAVEAEKLARRAGDPAALALALNARFMQEFSRAGLAPERRALGEELASLGAREHLVTFEVLGHLVRMQASCALADFAAAEAAASAAEELGTRYGIPLVAVFVRWYRAVRLASTAAFSTAAAAFRAAGSLLTGTGMSGVDNGVRAFALLCLEVLHDRPPSDGEFGGYEPWCRPLVSGTGVSSIPDSPHDLLFEARTCLHAVAAIRAGDHATVARLYEKLLPATGELAGAGSGLVTLGPVARYLARLAEALGRPEAAAEHRRQAAALQE